MSELTKEGLEILQHTTGASNGEYRNHFCTGKGSKDFPACQSLVAAGLMVSRGGGPLFGGDTVFHATEKGKQQAQLAFGHVKEFYDVTACIGRAVIVNGKPGVIAQDCGHYLGVNFDEDKPGHISHCHPAWEIEYKGMAKVRKMTRSQRRYKDYLRSECEESFSWWITGGAQLFMGSDYKA